MTSHVGRHNLFAHHLIRHIKFINLGLFLYMTINSFRHVQQIEIHHRHNLVLLPNECKPVTTYFCSAKKKKMCDVLLHKHFVARPLWWLYVDRDTMTFGCFMARCNSSTFDFILLRFTSFKGFIIRVNITFQLCFVKQKQEKT